MPIRPFLAGQARSQDNNQNVGCLRKCVRGLELKGGRRRCHGRSRALQCSLTSIVSLRSPRRARSQALIPLGRCSHTALSLRRVDGARKTVVKA